MTIMRRRSGVRMWVVDDVAGRTQSTLELIEQRGFLTFPAMPERPSLVVEWPHPADFDGFLELADELGVRMLYVDVMAAGQAFPGELPEELVGHVDEPVQMRVGWVQGGWLHLHGVVARWFDEFLVQRDFAEGLEMRDREARIEQAARRVVDDPSFHDRGSPDREQRQLAVIADQLPDLDPDERWAVLRHARRIDLTERKPQREREMADEARTLLGAPGAKKITVAAKLGVSPDVLNRILTQNPPQGRNAD